MKYFMSACGRTIKKISFAFLLSVLPFSLYAQGVALVSNGFTNIGGLINSFTTNVVQALGTLALAAAVVVFFFGIVEYIWGVRNGDGAKAKTGSTFMIWGLVALFVMFSVWGIIYFAQTLFGIQGINSLDQLNNQRRTTSQQTSPLDLGGGGLVIPAAGTYGQQPVDVSGFGNAPVGTTATQPAISQPTQQTAPASSGGQSTQGSSCEGKARGASCGTGMSCDYNEFGTFACYKNPTVNYTPPPKSPVSIADPPIEPSPKQTGLNDTQGEDMYTTNSYSFTTEGGPLSSKDGALSCSTGYIGKACGTGMRCALLATTGDPVLACFKAVDTK
jgi:hypothetical protein